MGRSTGEKSIVRHSWKPSQKTHIPDPEPLAVLRLKGRKVLYPSRINRDAGTTMRVIGKIRSALANEASGEYRCQQCGAEFELDRQVCPVCGGYRIESVEWSEE